ncbi:hypothetical protein Tco_0352747 [Tanacetum coccineum]
MHNSNALNPVELRRRNWPKPSDRRRIYQSFFNFGLDENGLLVVSGSGPAVTSNWEVCCALNPPVLPPIPPEGVKVPGGTRTRELP